MVKFLFTADIHANKTRAVDVVKFLKQCQELVKKENIDYFLIGGDLWDCMVTNTKNSGFVDITNELSNLCKITNVIDILGTSFHESEGSCNFLSLLGAKVCVLPELLTLKDDIKLLCIPEPRRSNFVRQSVEETNKAMNDSLTEACKNKADIIIFHGEVSGAKMDNGTLAKSEVQLTKNQIDRTGAKITLCGHIHTPQMVMSNVYYVGSPIPKNFGELHEPSVFVFGFENGEIVKLHRVKTNFPTYRTVNCDRKLFDKLYNLDFTNVNLKVNLTLTPEEHKIFHHRDKEKAIKDKTHAHSVKILVKSDKQIAVRSKDIIKTSSIIEKMKIYAEVNNILLTPNIINKIKDIEDNLLIKYISPSHSFELMSISLRGCKCIKGKEEVNIDFSRYSDGVVLLVGENGTGKSSLAENCLPYPCMLTRSGALRSFFYLKDSHRIVIYRDENNRYYKFTIQLAAHVATGLVKYFAEISDDEGKTWKSVAGVDGSLDAYKEYVESEFGSLELYLRTAFFTTEKTKGISDISSSTKSEKIALLSELLNFDSISTMHDICKDKLKELGKEIEKYENVEESKLECEKQIAEKTSKESVLQKDLKSIENELEELKKEISDTRKAETEFNANFGQFQSAIALKTKCEDDIAELTDHLNKLTEHKRENDFFKMHEKQIKEYKDILENSKPLQDYFNKTSKQLQEASQKLFEMTKEMNAAKEQYDTEQRKLDSVDNRIENAKKNLFEVVDICPTCGAKLSEKKKKDLAKANDYVQNEIDALKDFKINQKEIVNTVKKSYTNLKQKVNNIHEKEKELRQLYNQADGEYQSTRAYLDMNSEYDKYLNYVLVTNLESDIEKISVELKNAENMLKTLDGIEFIDYKTKLEELEAREKSKQDDRVSLSMDLGSIQSQIEQLKDTINVINSQYDIMQTLSKEYEEYSIIEQAFSNSGIQALELEAAAPDIADLTNSILHESYGDKFTISFSTLKQGRTKLVDDFSIDVTNHDTGWTIPLEQLSKGEKVWITQSLYFAFSILRMNKTNFSFKVRFVDESDGGLDGEKRLQYLQMIQSAHNSGNSRLTIMITHSQEIKDIVNQTIQL